MTRARAESISAGNGEITNNYPVDLLQAFILGLPLVDRWEHYRVSAGSEYTAKDVSKKEL